MPRLFPSQSSNIQLGALHTQWFFFPQAQFIIGAECCSIFESSEISLRHQWGGMESRQIWWEVSHFTSSNCQCSGSPFWALDRSSHALYMSYTILPPIKYLVLHLSKFSSYCLHKFVLSSLCLRNRASAWSKAESPSFAAYPVPVHL